MLKQYLWVLYFLTESKVVFSLVPGTLLGIFTLLSHLILIAVLENRFFFFFQVKKSCSENFCNLLIRIRTESQIPIFFFLQVGNYATGNGSEFICNGELNIPGRKGLAVHLLIPSPLKQCQSNAMCIGITWASCYRADSDPACLGGA